MVGATDVTIESHANASGWKRSTFNGWCQVIVASPKKPGTVLLDITSPGLAADEIRIGAN